jgi:hypothetical protein
MTSLFETLSEMLSLFSGGVLIVLGILLYVTWTSPPDQKKNGRDERR